MCTSIYHHLYHLVVFFSYSLLSILSVCFLYPRSYIVWSYQIGIRTTTFFFCVFWLDLSTAALRVTKKL